MYGVYPTDKYAAVSPSDSEALTYNSETRATRGIACAVTGTIVTKNSLGGSVTHYCAAGIIYPIRTQRVMTASTATGIVAYFD